MSNETPFFSVRWTLRAKSAWSQHTFSNAILYALLCDAARGDPADGPMHMPEGLLLDAPEIARDRVEPGEDYAFGATLIEGDPQRASRLLHRLSAGLVRLGREKPKKPVALGGNFDLIRVEDLVAGTTVPPDGNFLTLPQDRLNTECQRLYACLGQPITLRFLSPLRIELPGDQIADGSRYISDSNLNPGQVLRSLQKRLTSISIVRSDSEDDRFFTDDMIRLLSNRLVWLDLQYGRTTQRKSLGGSLGRIQIAVDNPAALAALVWGQYARIGRNLHFGFGRYRIEELGPDPSECRRAVPLLDLCLTPKRVEAAAAEFELEPTSFADAAERVRSGTYRPAPPHIVNLRSQDGSRRELQIPSRPDRALQRLLLKKLGPAIDKLFETSSFAWRKGLSRESAARRIERLVRDGWNYAVRADFDAFFESIPHAKLRDRLEAWIGDDSTVAAILGFVESGQPDGLGIPTGAPLSPLLGNLFLDQFDESIERAGGRLIRYADDFLVLSRTREEADRLHKTSADFAAELLLKLNDDSAVLDLREPFEFLGLRFEMIERWRYSGPTGPRLVRELGWRDADRTPSPLSIRLPGEVETGAALGTLVIGPGAEKIDVVADSLEVVPDHSAGERRIPLAELDQLLVLGPAGWTPDAPGKLLKAGVPVQFLSETGWPLGELRVDPADEPEAILAQCRAALDPVRTLAIAKSLVRAKLNNYAALFQALEPDGHPAIAALREFAGKTAAADTADSLRGIEGAGAALWYRHLGRFLGKGFSFGKRVAPDAHDPINLMLNIGFTMLHRQAVAAASAAGLTPSLGFLHASTPRYSALGADLQEPFRHLVERAVILASRRLKPAQFLPQADGPYAIRMEHHASKTFHAVLQRSWTASTTGRGQLEPRPWLAQIATTARLLRRHLLNPEHPWEPFEHP